MDLIALSRRLSAATGGPGATTLPSRAGSRPRLTVMDHRTRASRLIARVFGGPGNELACSVAFRSGPGWLVRLIDAAFYALRAGW